MHKAEIINGNEISRVIREEIRNETLVLREKTGVTPGLAVVLVGEDPASRISVRRKGLACAAVGFLSRELRLPADTPEAELLEVIGQLNGDPNIHGILVQLPLPDHLDEEAILSAGNLQLSEDDNVLVQGVEGDEYAIGYFGYAYFEENAGKLRDVSIEGVAPSAETVDANTYPLARPLFMYSDGGVLASKPQVAAFLNFVLSNVNDLVIDVGYFPASDEALDAARAAWLEAVGQ